MSEFIFVYVTCENVEQAKSISRVLVEEKLAACANVLAPMTSIYAWNGLVEEKEEVPMLIKTQARLFGEVEAKIKQIHGYDNPCIVSFALDQGSKEFLDWIKSNTGSKKP